MALKRLKDIIDAIASFGKVALKSRRPSAAGLPKAETLIVMGNGPSLRDAIDANSALLRSSDTLAVNFAANAPEFTSLRPKIYVLADPHFFSAVKTDPNVGRLWENLSATSWPMHLHVPCTAQVPALIGANPNIELKRFNMTPGEGWRPAVHWLYRRGLAMPRPRNVLIASLMIALREGYRGIRIVGADHSWSRDLWVDDRNRVISVQPHFYKDNPKELDRVALEYAGYHLHDILGSLTIAFRSYHRIAAYAETLGARITNCTPGSFIDAFPRTSLTADEAVSQNNNSNPGSPK